MVNLPCDPKAIEAFAKDDPPENLPGGTFDTISKKIESLDLGEDEKRGLEDILKTVEHALSEVVDDFDVTYETIRAYTNAERLTFENTLNYLISTPTKENLIGAVNQLKEKFEDKEQLQWMIELTFLMEYREKINTLIKESGFRDIESISLPPILKEYLQYKSGVPARLPILEITEGNSDYTDVTDYSYSDDESDNGDKFTPKLKLRKTCTGFDPYLRPLMIIQSNLKKLKECFARRSET